MRSRTGKFLVIVLVIFAVGWHWTLLQSAAWVGMAISYSQKASLPEALAKTFDGQHPCTLCLLVRQGKQREKASDKILVVKQLDLFSDISEIVILKPRFPAVAAINRFLPARSEPPPNPPPRTAASILS